MLGQRGLPIWWRALKLDFWSLSAWQAGMYGWMARGRIELSRIEFWFLMQLARACGLCPSCPMNWWSILGIKTAIWPSAPLRGSRICLDNKDFV
jgi:hypothetical protein